jgi:hypothetical protein
LIREDEIIIKKKYRCREIMGTAPANGRKGYI